MLTSIAVIILNQLGLVWVLVFWTFTFFINTKTVKMNYENKFVNFNFKKVSLNIISTFWNMAKQHRLWGVSRVFTDTTDFKYMESAICLTIRTWLLPVHCDWLPVHENQYLEFVLRLTWCLHLDWLLYMHSALRLTTSTLSLHWD